MALVQNHFHPDYAHVAKLFEAYASAEEEAQLVVYVGGELVLDLASNTSPDSLTTIYSVSKALSAFAMAKLVERGQLDLDQTVAHYWPEFAAKGKERVTVRELLSHQAGLPETDVPLTAEQFLDDHAAAEALANQRPFWQPGRGHGYHGLTIGPLISELCFRITGKTVQQFYEAEIRSVAAADGLHGADAYLGLPEALEPRVLELQPPLPPTPEQLAEFAPPARWSQGPIGLHVFGRGLGDFVTSAEGRRFGLPSAAGVASARGLARIFQWATGYGDQTKAGIDPDVIDRFSQVQAYGLDLTLDIPTRAYGVVFMKPHPMLVFGSHRAFGHDGAAGAFAYADPVGEIVLGYTIRRHPFPGGVDLRLMPIIDALREVATKTGAAAIGQARISG
jgi:CubicO group peptidase (beta-lactamase class C family)